MISNSLERYLVFAYNSAVGKTLTVTDCVF